MTFRHLVTRAQHLNLNITKTAITQHINSCQCCNANKLNANSFKIIRRCNTDYEAKVHEALLIKKHKPRLNSQSCANGRSLFAVCFLYCFVTNLQFHMSFSDYICASTLLCHHLAYFVIIYFYKLLLRDTS